jgi:hypothetical protein
VGIFWEKGGKEAELDCFSTAGKYSGMLAQKHQWKAFCEV